MKRLSVLAAMGALLFSTGSIFAHEGCCSSDEPTKAEQPAKAKAAQAAQTYTCPMHPEVTSDKPGKCPKCGMKLVVKKPEAKKKAETKQ